MSVSCRLVRRHIDAHVDGELDTSVQVQFESHLANCPVCREHAALCRTIKRAVKEQLGSAVAPERLRTRVLTALQSATPTRPTDVGPASREPAARSGWRLQVWMLPARYAVPAAAAAALAIALSARTDGDTDPNAVAAGAAPLLEDVVRRHASEHPPEVAGPPQQVVRWFRGKLEFPVRPVEFPQQPARFVGARLSNVRDRDAAAFYYDVRGHRVTVVVFEPPQRSLERAFGRGVERVNVHGRQLYYRQVRGYPVPVLEHEGLTYAFTGDLDRQSMIQLAASARLAR